MITVCISRYTGITDLIVMRARCLSNI